MSISIDNDNPSLLVIRGADADGFRGIYNQMDGAIKSFQEEYDKEKKKFNGKLNVIYARYNGEILRWFFEGSQEPQESFKQPQSIKTFVERFNPFAIVALGDNVISGLQKEDLSGEHLSKIPIITSVSGYRLLRRNNAFHLWPFVLPSLAYLAAEWIMREYSGVDSICIVTDANEGQGKVLRNVFSGTLSCLGKKVVTIDEGDESKLKELANTKVLTVVYVSGIGGNHDNALRCLLDAQSKNENLFIISDQSISDPTPDGEEERVVPRSENVQYFTSLLDGDGRWYYDNGTGGQESPFLAKKKFEFFVYQTLNLVCDKYDEFCKVVGQENSETSFVEFLKKTKTYETKKLGNGNASEVLFISDNGQLYTPLYIAHGDKVAPVGHYSYRPPLDIAHLLQVVDEQLKEIPFIHIGGKVKNDDIIRKLRRIGELICSVFETEYFYWIGDCFEAIGERIIYLSDRSNSEWAEKIVDVLQRNAIFDEATQIALGEDFELPDNDAVRAYFKHKCDDGMLLLPLSLRCRNSGTKKAVRGSVDNSQIVGEYDYLQKNNVNTSSKNAMFNDGKVLHKPARGVEDAVSTRTNRYFEKNSSHVGNSYRAENDDEADLEIFFSKDINIGLIKNEATRQSIDGRGKRIRGKDANDLFLRCQFIYDSRDKDASGKAKYVYVFPEALSGNGEREFQCRNNNCLLFVTHKRLSYLDLRVLTNVITRVAYSLRNAISSYRIKLEATKSAIGSIMSRNGSHNIGSHVLAALSHNVGTMPDDRVLYQYIQHRMDYIATVTTDAPTWTQPTMLLGSLMKGFLSQRHLLDHIVESEGLSAWKFQGPESLDQDHKGKHWIEFHVRKRKQVDGKYVYAELIEYPSGNVKLEEDVALAIPGGAVGYHAFYTILENIIRNAAKHDWSVQKNKIGESNLENLQIYIDIDNNDVADNENNDRNTDNVEIEVWSRLSGLRSEVKAPNVLPALEKGDIKSWHKDLESGSDKRIKEFSELPLPHKLQVMTERPFIKESGQLRRENWGLAEMKISAGYLCRSSIDVIGGLKLDEYKSESALILPTAVEKVVEVDGKDVSGTYLAYRFFIPKPRELLIIVENIDNNGDVRSQIADAEKLGVYVKTWQEILNDGNNNTRALELNYRYVVHPAVTKDVLTKSGVKFPFRVLSGAEAMGLNGMVPLFANYGEVVKGLLGEGSNDVKPAVEKALKYVYECWCSHIVKIYRKDIKLDKRKGEKIGLLITPSEHSQAGGHSLISDADILKYVMRECFEKCVEQYHVLNGTNEAKGGDSIYSVFVKLCEGPRNIPEDIGKLSVQNDIARLIHNWIRDALDRLGSPIRDQAETIKRDIEKCYNVSTAAKAVDNEDGRAARKAKKKARNENLRKEVAIKEVERILSKSSIDGFIEYIESVLEQVKSLFKQYEENIVSLPDGYRPKKDEGVNSDGGSEIKDLGDIAKVAFNAKLANSTAGVKWIAYRRHDNSLTDNITFAEPLSGTQSYLTQIARLADGLRTSSETTIANAEYFGLCVRLLENGLMRMLVIDERVAKFVREHKAEVGSFYKSMGITVLDDELKFSGGEADKKEEVVDVVNKFLKKHKNNLCNNQSGSSRDASSPTIGASCESLQGKFEILIIHQGILDKWFPNAKNDKKKMTDILEDFKKMVKYVVITTGRGTPSNIPEDVHLIPFAVVEAALFRKYPEKLILVDAVMNVLAVGKHESEGV